MWTERWTESEEVFSGPVPFPLYSFSGCLLGCGCSGAQAVSCVALEPCACQYCAFLLLLIGGDGVNLQVSFNHRVLCTCQDAALFDSKA